MFSPRHNPELFFFAMPAFDDEAADYRPAAPDDMRDDGDALAFFSLRADEAGAGE